MSEYTYRLKLDVKTLDEHPFAVPDGARIWKNRPDCTDLVQCAECGDWIPLNKSRESNLIRAWYSAHTYMTVCEKCYQKEKESIAIAASARIAPDARGKMGTGRD